MGNTCNAEKAPATTTDEVFVKQESNSGKNIIELAQEFAEAAVDTAKQMGQAVVTVAAAAAEDLQEAAVDLKEAVEDALDGIPTGVAVVEFTCPKGAVVKVDILSKQVGFEMGLSSSGCCSKGGKAKTVVKKITAGGPAAKAGVKKNFALKAINGTEVLGLEQAKKLLAEAVANLPEVPPPQLETAKEAVAAPAAAAAAPAEETTPAAKAEAEVAAPSAAA